MTARPRPTKQLLSAALAAGVAAWIGSPASGTAQATEASAASAEEVAEGRVHYIASCARCHGVNGGGGEGPTLARASLPRAPDDEALVSIVLDGISGTAMSASWWLSQGEAEQVVAYVRSLAPAADVEEILAGDPEAGRALFEREGCAGCHTVGGFGTNRGPDLTSVGLRRGAAYLREAVLDPGAALPRGHTAIASDFVDYLVVRVVDAEGNEVRGMRMNEDTYTIQIKDRRGTLRSYYKPTLRSLDKEFDASLMRSYRDDLTDEEVDDLVRYLMSLQQPSTRVIS